MVVPNSGSAHVSILRNVGGGRFAPLQDLVAETRTADAVFGDLNEDGRLDLIMAHQFEDGFVSIHYGQPDGSFATQRALETGARPRGLATADLDADGRLDLVSADAGSGTVTVQLADGQGWFLPSRSWAAGPGAAAVVATDLNGDGRLDLVAADSDSSTVAVLVGGGDGTYAAPRFFESGARPGAIAVADLDVDGQLDLVVANRGSQSVSVLIGARRDTSIPGRVRRRLANRNGSWPSTLDVSARPDVVTANAAPTLVAALQPQPSGSVTVSALGADVQADRVRITLERRSARASQTSRVFVERAPDPLAWTACQTLGSCRSVHGFEEASRWIGNCGGTGFVWKEFGGLWWFPVPLRAEPRTGLVFWSRSSRSGHADQQPVNRLVRPRSSVRLEIFDVRGHRVRLLRQEVLPAGTHVTVWDCTDGRGTTMSRGLYFARLVVDGRASVRKLALLRR